MTTSNTSTSNVLPETLNNDGSETVKASSREKEEKGVSLEEFMRTGVLAKSRAIGKTKKKGKGPQDRLKVGNGVGDRAILVSHRNPFVNPQIFVHVKGWH